MRSDTVQCADIATDLASDEELADLATRRHVASCLRCQAELASYRRLRRTMASLHAHPPAPSFDLASAIMMNLDREDARGGRWVPAAAATIGGLAAAAGVIVLATRQRRGHSWAV